MLGMMDCPNPENPRPVIADLIRNPEGRQCDAGENKTTPTNRIPSPLMGEESKVRVTQPLTLGTEGEQDNTNHPHHPPQHRQNPQDIARRENEYVPNT